jgi:protein-S-isoprenylcysteine O-methyltransferase Ste14
VTPVRYLGLLVPAALTLLAALAVHSGRQRHRRQRHGREWRREYGAALLASIAAAVGVAGLNEAARSTGWHSFAPVDGAFRGMPVDLWIGWAALWGAAPTLARRIVPVPVALALLLWLDLVAMPRLDPLVRLGPDWFVGEFVGLVAVALPAQLLGRWTADRRRLYGRCALQVAVFAGLSLWLVPTVAFEAGGGSWHHLADLDPRVLFVLAQVGLLVAAPAVLAVREFAVRGGGTPYPWDPPVTLVTTGPYAYLANPMQLSAVLLMLLLAAATRSGALALGTASVVAFAVAVAGPHEHSDLSARHGAGWHAYRRQVRAWWPRFTPYGPAARLGLDPDCGSCTAVARFLRRRRPHRLAIVRAGAHARRAEYVADDGHRERGVAAVARGLEHVNLAWAYTGWLLRLPGVGWLAQLVTDALIAPPRATAGDATSGGSGEQCPKPASRPAAGFPRPSSGWSTER